MSFKVSNTGFSPLTITKSKGPRLGQFSALEALNEGTILQPGDSRIIDIRFAPTAEGTFSDTYTLNSDTATGLKVLTFTGRAIKASGSISSIVGITPENVMLTQSGIAGWIRWNSADLTSFNAMNETRNQFGTLSRVGSGEITVITGRVCTVQLAQWNSDHLGLWKHGAIAVSDNKTWFPIYRTRRHKCSYFARVRRCTKGSRSVRKLFERRKFTTRRRLQFQQLRWQESHVYTISYQASKPGQSLTVAWIKTAGTGTISLSAASFVVRGADFDGFFR